MDKGRPLGGPFAWGQVLWSHLELSCRRGTPEPVNPLLVVDVTLTVTGEVPDGIFQNCFEVVEN